MEIMNGAKKDLPNATVVLGTTETVFAVAG